MRANIHNITIQYFGSQYCIMTEFSQYPIETFGNHEDAEDFVAGYLGLYDIGSKANHDGKMFRKFVEVDVRNGEVYRKINSITATAYVS